MEEKKCKDLTKILIEETQKFLQENRREVMKRAEKRLKKLRKDQEPII